MSDYTWKKENMVRIHLWFSKARDGKIIEWLESQPNKTDYIRDLINADIEQQEKNER